MTPPKNRKYQLFKYWPFGLVPAQGEALFWADRTNLKQQVITLGRRLGRHEAVSLHLLWADFGAGKTHTLLYLKQEIEKQEFGSLLPFYCALPKGCREFLDIYRAMVRSVPVPLLKDLYERGCKTAGREALENTLAGIWPNIPHCFQAISIGSPVQQSAALGWLHAETGLPTRALQGLSINGRIKSTDDAVLALCGIVQLCKLAGFPRAVFMVDEFQRVEVLRRQQQDDINAGLHSFFNSCGSGMSLILSFSFGVEENIRHFLNAELLSRVDPLRISIPVLSGDEGRAFLTEVIGQARNPNSGWPVSDDAIPAIVSALEAKLKITPRRLLKAAGLVFEFAEMDLDDGVISALTAEYIATMVADGKFDRIDQNEDA